MSIFYRLSQNNMDGSKMFGKWYGRAVHLNTVDLNDIAKQIQANTTAKEADVMAVLTELVEVMQRELQASSRVRLNGIGTFKVTFASSGADTADLWSALDNVKKFRINFMPEYTTVKTAGGKRRKDTPLLRNCKAQELPVNTVIHGDDDEGGDEPQP